MATTDIPVTGTIVPLIKISVTGEIGLPYRKFIGVSGSLGDLTARFIRVTGTIGVPLERLQPISSSLSSSKPGLWTGSMQAYHVLQQGPHDLLIDDVVIPVWVTGIRVIKRDKTHIYDMAFGEPTPESAPSSLGVQLNPLCVTHTPEHPFHRDVILLPGQEVVFPKSDKVVRKKVCDDGRETVGAWLQRAATECGVQLEIINGDSGGFEEGGEFVKVLDAKICWRHVFDPYGKPFQTVVDTFLGGYQAEIYTDSRGTMRAKGTGAAPIAGFAEVFEIEDLESETLEIASGHLGKNDPTGDANVRVRVRFKKVRPHCLQPDPIRPVEDNEKIIKKKFVGKEDQLRQMAEWHSAQLSTTVRGRQGPSRSLRFYRSVQVTGTIGEVKTGVLPRISDRVWRIIAVTGTIG
ncbi:MAG: hypothetical protein ACRC1W_03745 [Shewanella sp.]